MFVGILSGCMILTSGNPLSAINMTFNKLIGVVSSGWNTKIILFAILIGGMIKLMQVSGYAGRDALSDAPPLVFFVDYSWMTDKACYNMTEGELTVFPGHEDEVPRSSTAPT